MLKRFLIVSAWARLDALRAPTLLVLATLGSACGGGSAETPEPAPGIDTDPQTGSHVADYLAEMRRLRAEQPCPPAPLLCAPGAPSGSATGAELHAWIARRLGALPAMRDVGHQPFAIPAFNVLDARIAVPGADLPTVLPWHYSGTTPAHGIEAPLLDIGAGGLVGDLLEGLLPQDVAGRIVLLDGERLLNAESGAQRRRLAQLEEAGAAGAVVSIPDVPNNLIMAHNRDSREGFGALPTLFIGKQDAAQLRNHSGEMAQLVLEAETAPASAERAFARNTSAWLPGVDDSRWLVIGTPVNSWLLAAAERGPGIAVFLQLAEELAQRVAREGALPYPVHFVATGGHEIFQFGLQRFLACTDTGRIGAYVHSGAGLISRGHRQSGGEPRPDGGLSGTRTLTVSENLPLRAITRQPFSNGALRPLFDLPPLLFRPGESRVAWEMGIPTVSLSGTNVYHHTIGDDESQIAYEALPALLAAYRDTIDGLLSSDLDTVRAGELGSDLRQPPQPALPCAGPLPAFNG